MLPVLLAHGTLMTWLLLALSAIVIVVFIERLLHYHRAQINSMEFLNGVRNVLKRDNVVEALSICEATPGPVARLVKTAILNRERGREGVRDALEEAGLLEVPAGGWHLGCADFDGRRPRRGNPHLCRLQLSRQPRQQHRARHGESLDGNPQHCRRRDQLEQPMKFPRNARIFRGQLDASPFVGVLFLVAIFLLLNSSLVFVPGVAIKLPEAADLPGVIGPTVTVTVDSNRHLYFRSQIIKESDLQVELRKAALETKERQTLMLVTDKTVSVDMLVQLAKLARAAGLEEAILVTRPPAAPARTKAAR